MAHRLAHGDADRTIGEGHDLIPVTSHLGPPKVAATKRTAVARLGTSGAAAGSNARWSLDSMGRWETAPMGGHVKGSQVRSWWRGRRTAADGQCSRNLQRRAKPRQDSRCAEVRQGPGVDTAVLEFGLSDVPCIPKDELAKVRGRDRMGARLRAAE